MQNSQEINWLVILLPSVVVGIIAILSQVISTLWLSRKTEDYKKILSLETEDYKKEINKELETHKIQLLREFQTRFHEFQTRYTLLHKERAEVLKKLYSLLTKLNSMVSHYYYDIIYETHQISKEEIISQYTSFVDYKDANKILLSKQINKKLDSVSHEILLILVGADIVSEIIHNSKIIEGKIAHDIEDTDTRMDKLKVPLQEKAGSPKDTLEKIFEIVPSLTKELENEFRKLLSD